MAKKNLGQNFLLNMDVVRRVAKVAGSLKGETVIEIGPGPGGLTRALLEAEAANIIVIERDARCLPLLAELSEACPGTLNVIHGDALKIKPQSLTNLPFRIIANLPYNIGTELLIRWLEDLTNVQSFTLMFQKEVALRIVALPNTKDYGRLAILCQYLLHTSRVFDLPPGVFTPPPKVTSSVVHLVPKQLTLEELSLVPYLSRVTQCAFGQRRKMLRSSLKPILSEDEIISAGIDPNFRPEQLALDSFIALALLLKKKS
ncbi:16S rRNA (adenine(1518)-N(6)/adenine(1519)-N(6))-dimethyltransferase RsmA [Candidatus Paracaedibacter symbiosus]|uniref:16S rRNA (adenine(1518)-N(6)/adenine(1519)-N(6))- dimethyltransferase RsmA n=1 Tax=Candidatus Paracaedibacter symbiosus TaxID=244582 RepID=UPI00068C3937|nr:16S rRNA (adenine(1518)-N(6)/adenine(1519)-N(6))-dimethyltransferase RsmA [Candidatus Paracaedibacter symbiosus]